MFDLMSDGYMCRSSVAQKQTFRSEDEGRNNTSRVLTPNVSSCKRLIGLNLMMRHHDDKHQNKSENPIVGIVFVGFTGW